MTKEDIEIEACLYEDGCHNPSIRQHFIDGAEWVLNQLKNIDEDKLAELAEEYAKLHWTNPMFAQEIEECKRDYKAGYRKAMKSDD